MTTDNTYDIVFAGGGAAGCITASRLAEADPNLKILVIEAGPGVRDVPDVVQPARYMRNLMRGAPTITYHTSKPSPSTANRVLIVPTGRCLGGGSSVNFAMYTRASASDYDDWERAYQNPGWGSNHLIPLLKKAETFQSEQGDPNLHGKNGPLKISYAKDQVNVAEEWLKVAAIYDKDRKPTDDVNGFYSCNEYGRWARYIDQTNGHRSDISHNYIYNHPEFKNLTILTSRRVTRVLFEGNRAVGVEHVDDVQGRPKKLSTDAIVSKASRLVVLSAGAFGSPAILERSGIGGAELLGKLGVQTLVDLPGVGEHYMDHNLVFHAYTASDDADTLDTLFRGADEEILPFANEWLQGGSGLMAHNGVDAGIKLRPSEKDLEDIGPEFKARWEEYYANAPDKPLFFFGVMAGTNGMVPVDAKRKYYGTGYYTEYPASTGRLHITDGSSPYAPVNFEPGFLDDPADVVILRWGYKKAREFARRMKFYRGEVKLSHPAFPEGSALAAQETADGPVALDAPKLQYTAEDDKIIDEFHRKAIGTSWHSIGTCAMKPLEKGGVVDPRLNVYGVQNLKVADCSICPSNVGANTYNTAVAIGEKAAVIIAADLGIAGVTEA